MPTGGNLRIAARTVNVTPGQTIDAAVPVPAALQPGNYALVSVSDTGLGISPDIASR